MAVPAASTARVGGLVWPVATAVADAIVHRFGENRPEGGAAWYSKGIDVSARDGAPVTAARDGRVVYAGWTGGHGNVVILEHEDGINTVYGHLATLEVSPGERKRQGERVGRVGSTGLAESPRLHFEVRVAGRAQDPMEYLPPLR